SANSTYFNTTRRVVTCSLSLHDALPICQLCANLFIAHSRRIQLINLPNCIGLFGVNHVGSILQIVTNNIAVSVQRPLLPADALRSEEHTSALQSRFDLVCSLLLEKKKRK